MYELTEEQKAEMTPEDLASFEFMADYFAKEDLLPDLAPFVHEMDTGTHLKHPYVIQTFFSPHHHKMANAAFKYKVEAVAEAFKEEKWHTFIFLHERPWRFEAFQIVGPLLDEREYWEQFARVWMDSENLFECEGILQEIFNGTHGDPRLMMDADDMPLWNSLDDTVTVYRGWVMDGTGWGRSWTLDRDRAEWFGTRWGHDGYLCIGEIPKEKILACLVGRGELEVIVDPDDGPLEIEVIELDASEHEKISSPISIPE